MGVPISNVTRRVVYAASGTGPYAFTFEILANTDVAVYRDDTLLTLTTDYTVTIAGNGTGSITLVAAPTGATQIAIVGNRTIQRTTDFVTGGDFFANTVNDEMDQQTIFAQQNAEGLQRALSAPQTDPTSINMTLPRAAVRANKTLGFDANGNPAIGDTLGTNRGNWQSGTAYYVRDIVKDTTNNNIWQCIVLHTSSGSQPINTNADSAKWTLLVDAASATQSATDAANSATSASGSATTATTKAAEALSSATAAASAQAATESARDLAVASYDAFDDRYLGAKSSNPSVDNDGNALLTGAIYFNSVANTMRVYNGSSWQDQAASPDTIAERSFSATAGQTSYTFTGGYRVGYTYVYVNGALLAAADITATDGTTITFTNALSLDDEVRILSYKAIGSVAIGDISGLQTALDAKASLTGVETLTNKTLTAPTIASANLTTALTVAGASGTAGQFLRSGGSGAAPTWASTAMTLISTQTAANSASLIFSGLSGYNRYMLIYNNILTGSSLASLDFVFGTGGTPTYITANYTELTIRGAGAAPTGNGGTGRSQGYLATPANAGAYAYSGYSIFNGMTSNGQVSSISTWNVTTTLTMAAGTNFVHAPSGGVNITAIKIQFPSGNITSGTASLYGISS